MLTSELIAVLKERLETHGDLEVSATWEGIAVGIESDSVYKTKSGCLFIDADDNFYKNRFAVDPNEGA